MSAQSVSITCSPLLSSSDYENYIKGMKWIHDFARKIGKRRPVGVTLFSQKAVVFFE